MSRARRPGVLAAVAVAAACAALALTAATSGADGPRVVVRDAAGEIVAEAALPADGRFALAYRHSVYRAPAEEWFRADGDRFVLERVSSRNRRVLEYYEAEGRIARGELVPDHPARFTTMALAATERGRRTLVVGGERIPLYELGLHLRIALEGT
jgi:hypothetical protein